MNDSEGSDGCADICGNGFGDGGDWIAGMSMMVVVVIKVLVLMMLTVVKVLMMVVCEVFDVVCCHCPRAETTGLGNCNCLQSLMLLVTSRH